MIFWSARYLSWSAVFGSPNSDAGAMVAFASTRLPSMILTKPIILAFAFRIRLLEGVKNPSEARFFSTLTNSTRDGYAVSGGDASNKSPEGEPFVGFGF